MQAAASLGSHAGRGDHQVARLAIEPNAAYATGRPDMSRSLRAAHITTEELAMLNQLLHDEGGFIISAELVLVATICVVGLIVGLSEVQHSINGELNDVSNAIGMLNQSYYFSGFHKFDYGNVIHAATYGSFFVDQTDDCDCNSCDIACDAPAAEAPKHYGYGPNCAGTCAGY